MKYKFSTLMTPLYTALFRANHIEKFFQESKTWFDILFFFSQQKSGPRFSLKLSIFSHFFLLPNYSFLLLKLVWKYCGNKLVIFLPQFGKIPPKYNILSVTVMIWRKKEFFKSPWEILNATVIHSLKKNPNILAPFDWFWLVSKV